MGTTATQGLKRKDGVKEKSKVKFKMENLSSLSMDVVRVGQVPRVPRQLIPIFAVLS